MAQQAALDVFRETPDTDADLNPSADATTDTSDDEAVTSGATERHNPAKRWECPACGRWSETCYRCDECGADLAEKGARAVRHREYEAREAARERQSTEASA